MNLDFFHVSNALFFSSIVLGFVAQMVGSSLGMAYSVLSSSVLLSLGLPPAVTSACVHSSEVINRLVSGISHFRYGNVDASIFKKLALSGMVGAFIGAFVVASMPVRFMRPLVAVFLFAMGIRIILMGFHKVSVQAKSPTHLTPLGFIGGFVDVIGGGGWGPVVTSTLIIQGHETNRVVGSINFAKFFVAIVESVTLIALLKSAQWSIITGLIVGGVMAAPLAAFSCSKIPPRFLILSVGTLICTLSIRTLYKAFM